MARDVSWGASLGSQMLAEISLLEAKANNDRPQACTIFAESFANRTSIVTASDHSAHEEGLKIPSDVFSIITSNDQLSTGTNSASVSLAGLLSSDPSELKTGISSNAEKKKD